MLTRILSTSDLIARLIDRQPEAAALFEKPADVQKAEGYFHTLREICQQPATWIDTAARMSSHTQMLRERVDGIASIALTGSGSSEFVGETVRAGLRRDLGVDHMQSARQSCHGLHR
jgi:tagatose-6-phosphate ketose/aldose isomerase